MVMMVEKAEVVVEVDQIALLVMAELVEEEEEEVVLHIFLLEMVVMVEVVE